MVAREGGASDPAGGAGGGSLFLDEIADMPLDLQAELLRVLLEKEVEGLGGTRAMRVDFRLMVATHRAGGSQPSRGGLRRLWPR